MKKKLLSIVLAVVLVASMIPLAVIPAVAATDVAYIDRTWDATAKKVVETKKTASATAITSNSTTLNSGWYVVSGTVTVSDKITVNGTPSAPTRIILKDGCKLTVSKGIRVSDDYALVIYDQAGGTGEIETKGYVSAGIGAGNDASTSGGTITINGGTVTATGNNSAGIGGGKGAGGTITINGGTVTASGGNGGAGIGGGNAVGASGTITINGGTVTATGATTGGAGIGGGRGCDGGTITINGGTVTATGGIYKKSYSHCGGAGIGGGQDGAGGTITISGGTVTAYGGGSMATGIGAGSGNTDADGVISKSQGTLTVSNKNNVIKSGDAAPGSATTVANYTTARSRYVYIHNHDFTASYIDNGDGTHSGKCACKTVSTEKVAHTFVSGKCTFCGAEEPKHEHTFAEAWSKDETAHWHVCTADGCDIENYATCGIEDVAYGEHQWRAAVAADGETAYCAATCEAKGWYKNVCEVCGAISEEKTDISVLGHNLVWDGNVGENGQHTLDCSRCEYTEKEDCTYINGVCTVCGAEEPHVHDFTGEYVPFNEIFHQRKCTGCEELGSEKTTHCDNDGDYICDLCNYALVGLKIADSVIELTNYATETKIENTAMVNTLNEAIELLQAAETLEDVDKAVEDSKALIDATEIAETKYENYLVEGSEPIANGDSGLFNRASYYIDDEGKEVVLDDAVYDTDKSVTFEQWYLRTMVQYKNEDDDAIRLRFVTMLDENLDNYEEAGFIYTVDDVEDKLVSYEGKASYEADGKTYYITDFSQEDDFFVLQNTLFAKEVVDRNPDFTVKAYVKLMDGTVLTGKTVSFHISDFLN